MTDAPAPSADGATAPISPELASVIEMVRSSGISDASLSLSDRSALLQVDIAAPEEVAVEVVDVDGVRGEWIVAPGAATDRAVLHLHGGAYTGGGTGSHRGFAAALSAGAGCAVFLADYRLAPAHPFPAALVDAVSALSWLTDASAGKGLDPASVVVCGDSAGGGLAVSLLCAWRDEVDAATLPAAAVLLSPWTDLAFTGASYETMDGQDPMCSKATLAQSVEAYVPTGVDVTDPRVSPLYADLAGLPPLLVHVGEVEVLRDDSITLVDRAREAGVDVDLLVAPGMVHVWHLFAGLAPESTRDLETVTTWIRAHHP